MMMSQINIVKLKNAELGQFLFSLSSSLAHHFSSSTSDKT